MNDAKIVAITQPLISNSLFSQYDGNMSVDEFIAYVARVSNPANQNNSITANKLIKYLLKHKHVSPFEMVHIVQEINTTRDIGRQILRHKSFSFQEFSQRYADPTQMGFVTREARLQDDKNRQNSIEVNNETLQNRWEEYQQVVKNNALNAYNWALKEGIAKEQARAVLPEGLTITKLYMAGTLRSWIHYCKLRGFEEGTQKEHKQVAYSAWKEIEHYFPSLEGIMEEE